jgi:glycosyltransferase involved in cell wall biosynthesis
MKIVYFIDHLRPDGTQAALTQLASGLATRGHQQTIFCLNGSWDRGVVNRLQGAGAEVRVVGKAALATGYGLVVMWRWLRRSQPDVAVTLLYVSDIIGRTLARMAKVRRIVSSIRARNANYSPLQRWLARITMRSVDAVIVNSVHVRQFAIEQEGAPPDRTFIVPNGVRVDDYTAANCSTTVREELGLSHQNKLVGSIGRLTRQKAFDVLLKAISVFDGPALDLVICGMGEEESRLCSLADQLGVGKQVHFMGYREDIPALLRSLDLYVHPARFEGMPNAVIEAMAAACPVAATDVDGTRELIKQGEHGWLVPPENAVALASAIKEALADPVEARRRGVLAQRRVAEHFTTEKMVRSWEDILLGKQVSS